MGDLVDVDDSGVVESDLGGLVETAAAEAVAEATAVEAAAVVAKGESRETLTTCEDGQSKCSDPNDNTQWQHNGGGFYQAVVEVHPTRIVIAPVNGVDNGGKAFVESSAEAQEHVNGDYYSDSYEEGEEEEMELEQTEYETEIELNQDDQSEDRTEYETEAIEEDLDTDDYTFVEISVYELQEVSERVQKCEVTKDVFDNNNNGGGSCVAVLTEVANDASDVEESSISKDESEINGIEVDCGDNGGEEILANNSEALTNGNNAKRKRNRGHSQTRRRRNRRNWK